MTKYKIMAISMLTIFTTFSGCNFFKKEAAKPGPYPEWVKSGVLYKINTRQYSPEGTFKALEADLPRIKELGVDILCLMPIYPIGEKDRKIREGATTGLGSYYSVRDYNAINPEFGTLDDFKKFVNKAHEMGFKVIVDWVANHTARDHAWITEHPEWYKKDDKGDIKSPFDWTDCAQLDYDKKDLRKAMVDAMKFWVQNFDIDGFGCDLAGLVPAGFWDDARAELQKVKPLYILAENEDNPELCRIAFDANYGWEMHHLMKAIAMGKQDAEAILKVQSKIDSLMPQRSFKLNFITSYDENSGNGKARENFSNAEKACAVLTYTLPGMPMIYNGQETGMTQRLRVFSKDTINLNNDATMFQFYQTLNGLKHRNSALWNPPNGGKLMPLTNDAPRKIISFLRSSGNSRVLLLANMSADTITTTITTDIADGKYVNTFNQNKINFNPENRECYFEPWGYLVLEGE